MITIKYIKVSIANIVTMVNKKTSKRREDITTIQISKETKKMLEELGNKGDTYEDIIKKILKK